MSTLPYDAEIEYLEGTGTQYIDTGFYPNQDTRAILDMSLIGVRGGSTIWGCRTSNSDKQFYFIPVVNGTKSRWSYGNKSNETESSLSDGHYTFDANKSTLNVSGTVTRTYTNTTSSFTCEYSFTIFGLNTSGGTKVVDGIIRLYGCQLYDNGTLVRDYIPVRVGQTGYLYDKVSETLIGNAGTGDFILGEDKALPNPFGFRRRLMVIESSKVENPYITDGLVAMWDGIWNAGIGEHTQSDAGFKDIVSGNTIPVGGYGSWNDNNIDSNYSVESNGLKCNTRNKMIGIGIPITFNMGYEYTIEYVRTITQFRSSNVGNCFATYPYNNNGNNRMIEQHNYQYYGFRIKGKNDTGGNVSEWSIRNEELGVEKVSIRLDSTYLMTVMYNNTKYTKTMKIYLTNSNITHICLNTSGHVASLNCFRVYNRPLSDEEFLHNYNVDLERF